MMRMTSRILIAGLVMSGVAHLFANEADPGGALFGTPTISIELNELNRQILASRNGPSILACPAGYCPIRGKCKPCPR
jgi:hypothetical protein